MTRKFDPDVDLLPASAAARHAGKSVSLIYKLVRAGKLPFVSVGGIRFFSRERIEQLAKERSKANG